VVATNKEETVSGKCSICMKFHTKKIQYRKLSLAK
jgi:hypothetical protein